MGHKGRSTSVEAILEATRRVIAERGPGKLTLSAIAETAAVSLPQSCSCGWPLTRAAG